ncbi:MAG: hypothetical protein QOI64_662 [Solirubrobacteraceae bacterium]|jgi:hypothetical protein|nr:hypothetical protein [Solirubrobacteraceae bacterium]
MTVPRRALAVLPLGALVAAAVASPAGAAVVKTEPCARYVAGQQTMTIIGADFTPNGFVNLSSLSKAKPALAPFASSQVQPTGIFLQSALPPAFSSPSRNLESFTLVATDTTNPALPILATTPFQVVRFGLTTKPSPKRPTSKVTYTARGFTTGKRVYIHFRFDGVTRRTVSLGIAKGPCGIASKRMRALPTKARYGQWTSYTNQSKKFKASTRPAWKDSFTIFRTFG